MGERDFIGKLQSQFANSSHPQLKLGIGDDAAVIDRGDYFELISTDMFVEGDHFRLDWFSAADVAHKCIEASVSDVYAMGGKPEFVFLSISRSDQITDQFLTDFFNSVATRLQIHHAVLAGGDTTHGRLCVIDVCVVGRVEKTHLCLRSGAQAGDRVCVTGPLGGSWAGLELFRAGSTDFPPRVREKYLNPQCRPDISQILKKYVSALIDISDGVGSEIRHICQHSGVGAEIIAEQIPLFDGVDLVAKQMQKDPLSFALSGGEDFELMFTISPEHLAKLREETTGFTEIGTITDGHDIILIRDGKRLEMPGGYDHFNPH